MMVKYRGMQTRVYVLSPTQPFNVAIDGRQTALYEQQNLLAKSKSSVSVFLIRIPCPCRLAQPDEPQNFRQ